MRTPVKEHTHAKRPCPVSAAFADRREQSPTYPESGHWRRHELLANSDSGISSQAGPTIDLGDHCCSGVWSIISREILARQVARQTEQMAKHPVGLAIIGNIFRGYRHDLTGNSRNQLITHIDRIKESNAPAAVPPFESIEEARVTRELRFDAADFSRNIDDCWQRCHSALAV